MRTRILVFLVFALVLGGVGAVGYFRANERKEMVEPPVVKPEVVRCAPILFRPYTVEETFWGRIEPNAEINMSFQIAGRLVQLGMTDEEADRLHENDAVRKDEMIAMLDTARYDALIAQARAQKNEASAAMDSARALLSQAKSQQADAKLEWEKKLEISRRGGGQPREVEKAKLVFDIAKSAVDGAQAKVDAAQASYEAADATITVAQVNLKDAKLLAPFAGRIAAVPVEVGEMVQPGNMVMRLVDLSKVKLVIGVVERKLPQLEVGQNVEIEVQALIAQAKTLGTIGSQVEPRIGKVTIVPPASDPITGLFNVEIELDNKDDSLKPGMIGKATIALRTEDRAAAIPVDAVKRKGNKISAFFVTDGLPVGLDLGELGRSELKVPVNVVQEVTFDKVILDNDFYLLRKVPEGLSRLVVEGQSRVVPGRPVMVLSGQPQTRQPFVKDQGSDTSNSPIRSAIVDEPNTQP